MERRFFKRRSTVLRATAHVRRLKVEVSLDDLSVSGCRVAACVSWFKGGDVLVLALKNGMRISGRIIWAEGNCFGVSFDASLHPAVVTSLGYPKVTSLTGMITARKALT